MYEVNPIIRVVPIERKKENKFMNTFTILSLDTVIFLASHNYLESVPHFHIFH